MQDERAKLVGGWHRWSMVVLWLSLGCWVASSNSLRGGGTALHWVVVVNGKSEASRTLANHYCRLRGIPAINVVVLPDVPPLEQTTVEIFRQKILVPILEEIQRRGLANHIHGIAYSCDFPTAVDLMADLVNLKERSEYLTPVGSLTGLTYLYRLVLDRSPAMLMMDSNFFAARPGRQLLLLPQNPEWLQQWQLFLDAVAEQDVEKSEAMAKALLQMSPADCGVSYRCAQELAKAQMKTAAIKMLEISVAQGWSFRKQMVEDPVFKELQGESAFQVLRDSCPDLDFNCTPTRGFETRNFYSRNGTPYRDSRYGLPYLMAMSLGVTRGAGTTLPEAIQILERAVQADGTDPEGTFYFTKTEDVRTKTREPFFSMAINRLKELGKSGEVVESNMPMVKDRCLGVTMGTPSFRWEASASRIVPGGIAENLTSLGGVMTAGSAQTKLTELLLAGAAASSGAVTEPYSILEKFPHPMIHAHYAAGLTAAEAYANSVSGPYQLLVVGDPLCRPFGTVPEMTVTGLEEGDTVSRTIELKVVKTDRKASFIPLRFDLLLDGRLAQTAPKLDKLKLNFDPPLPSGYHELSLIVTDESPLANRWSTTIGFWTGSIEERVKLERLDEGVRGAGSRIECKVTGPEGSRVQLRHDWEVIAESDQAEAVFEVSPVKLGAGPVRLIAVAVAQGVEHYSKPMVVDVPMP
jgi:hypothetical protein